MRKSETLVGHGTFGRILAVGNKLRGETLQCTYIVQRGVGAPGFRAGLKIRGKDLNAVCRNRIKRLLREALTAEREAFVEVMRTTGHHVSVVFVYDLEWPSDSRPPSLPGIRKDITLFFRAIAGRVRGQQ